MKFSTAAALLSGCAVSTVYAAVGDSCTAPEGTGSCQATGNCKGISYPENLCPNDPADVQCCVEVACRVEAGDGFCRSKANNGCAGGSFHAGTGEPWPCPGGNDIQCCVQNGEPEPPSGGDDVGAKILEVAMTAAGTPYAWGGGTCDGPSGDIPPYDYGEIGYDCSGLVCWAVCQVTGRDLFSEGLRVTNAMYCAGEGKLGYKKYPFAERIAGDAVFFGGSCDCNDASSIYHVGLMMDSGDRFWNAPNDRVNQVQENSVSGFGDKPCPYVIRFTA